MQREFKETVQSLVPPMLWRGVRTAVSRFRRSDIRFVGDYSSWGQAKAVSKGYDADDILARAAVATTKVLRGEAAFERDGVAYPMLEPHFPMAWALMRAAVRHGRLHVLDFGGALGSTYYQVRRLIDAVPDVCWAIVEQPAHVAVGRRQFSNRELTFHDSLDSARQSADMDVLLLSSVLQYLPDPFEFIRSILTLGFSTVILDRVPFMNNGSTRLTVQQVPEWIGRASYPAWFFAESRFLVPFASCYELVTSWSGTDEVHPDHGRACFKGFLFEVSTTARGRRV